MGQGIGATVSQPSAAACSEACCVQDGCTAWSFGSELGRCSLFSGYAAPRVDMNSTSGLVYRGRRDSVSSYRGFNYVPPSRVNSIDMWADYDPGVVERDMAIARQAGFNLARVFLNVVVWQADADAFVRSLRHFRGHGAPQQFSDGKQGPRYSRYVG